MKLYATTIDVPDGKHQCQIVGQVREVTHEHCAALLWSLKAKGIPAKIWMPHGLEPMRNVDMKGNPPAALIPVIEIYDRNLVPSVEELVVQGLNSVYAELGRYWGDSPTLVEDVRKAAAEYAETCLEDFAV